MVNDNETYNRILVTTRQLKTDVFPWDYGISLWNQVIVSGTIFEWGLEKE